MSVLWVRTGSHSEPGVLKPEESSSHEYVSHGFLLHGCPASPRVLSAGHSGFVPEAPLGTAGPSPPPPGAQMQQAGL